ncbi:uncharacterized protein [Sinocyclocheilus grahami]|uniref:uncharacterized protein isoform X4 n=1 Tax=Sinocyclocheilus grahami TaxID=75366 RepID=UPI0007AD1AA9|nr:PREDICTED: uncharacterized protein LOC107593958 isoform X4 [Sinocyclocheilus grahami]
MDGPVDGIKLIRRHKTELLEALTGDPDVLLQRCHASGILSNNEYNNIKDTNMRSKQLQINKRKTPKNTVHAVIDFGLSETTAKRRQEMENEPLHSRMVSEKEMMMVAGCIGNSWREVGIMALGMNTTTLQQIEEDNSQHKMRVFTMLRKWSMREREQATAARLHSLLTQEENGMDTLKLNFLLEDN